MVGTAIPVKCSPIDDFIAVIKKNKEKKLKTNLLATDKKQQKLIETLVFVLWYSSGASRVIKQHF